MYKNLIAALFAFALFSAPTLAAQGDAKAQVDAKGQGNTKSQPSTSPLKVGFVYVTPRLPSGWVHQHELGRLAMEEKLNKNGRKVQTVFVENVAEGADAERVIRDMAGWSDIHTQFWLYGAHAESGRRVSQCEVRVHYRLQNRPQCVSGKCALLRRSFLGRYRCRTSQ